MDLETTLAFAAVAIIAILSPGPAILLALRNIITFGTNAVIWSSLGNISGLFCLSASAMLGLGLLLKSSALLFGFVKILGAVYLFYIGVRHLIGGASLLSVEANGATSTVLPTQRQLFREGMLIAITNPKPILFSQHSFRNSSAKTRRSFLSSSFSLEFLCFCPSSRCLDTQWLQRVPELFCEDRYLPCGSIG